MASKENYDWGKAFDDLDTSKDGNLSVDELRRGLEQRDIKCSKYAIESALKSLDQNNDGRVSKAEFVKVMSQKSIHDEGELKKAFDEFDKDKSGFITKNELKKAMESIGLDPSTQDIEELIRSISKDDDKIDYEEFVKAMR